MLNGIGEFVAILPRYWEEPGTRIEVRFLFVVEGNAACVYDYPCPWLKIMEME